jgi:hypothetical protein
LAYSIELLRCVLRSDVDIDSAQPWRRDGPAYGDPRLTPQRLGQQAFQAVVVAPTAQLRHPGRIDAAFTAAVNRPAGSSNRTA